MGVGKPWRVWLGCLLVAAAVAAQDAPMMLRDISTQPVPAVPVFWAAGGAVYVEVGGSVLFDAWHPTHGTELWRTDGTTAGTRMVRDICPGSCSGRSLAELVVSGGIAYFGADDGAHGAELWRSDGTAAGTWRVADVWPGLGSSRPQHLVAAPGGGVYFVAHDGVHGQELWTSDGTAGGTHLVADVWPGIEPQRTSGASGPTHLGMLGTTLLFAADDGVHGHELWRTDGTAAGTSLIADTKPGGASGITYYQAFPEPWTAPAVAGGKYFFGGGGSGDEQIPWVSDGTTTGTFPLVGPQAYSWVSWIRPFDDVVLFVFSGLDTATMWRSDGTPAGTFPLAPGLLGSATIRLGDRAFFRGFSETSGAELWATDGTPGGTVLVEDIVPGSTGALYWSLRGFVTAGGRIYFPADDGAHGLELWSSDGTPGGASMVGDLMPGAGWSIDPFEMPVFPLDALGGLFLRVQTERGLEIVRLDQTTNALTTLHGNGERPSSVPYCLLYNCPAITPTPGGVLFVALDAAHGSEPWVSDGSPTGTVLRADLTPGEADSMTGGLGVRSFAAIGNRDLMTGFDADYDRFLWAVESGQPPQQILAANVWELVTWKGAAYVGGGGLWRTDGTGLGTSLLVAGWSGNLLGGEDLLFFQGPDGLWATDGTLAGSRGLPAADPRPASAMALTKDPTTGADRLFFASADEDTGNELWVTDGTDGGTLAIGDLRPGPEDALPRYASWQEPLNSALTTLDGHALFAANDGIHGEELWVAGGGPGDTTRIDIFPGPRGSEPRWLTLVGDRVYFVADDGVHGREVWVSDGTPAGTMMVADLRNGPESSAAGELTAMDAALVFAGDDGVSGPELWKADGVGKVGLVADLWPGDEGSSPQGLTVSGSRLFFYADDGIHGLEPYAWPAAASLPLRSDGFESGDLRGWNAAIPIPH